VVSSAQRVICHRLVVHSRPFEGRNGAISISSFGLIECGSADFNLLYCSHKTVWATDKSWVKVLPNSVHVAPGNKARAKLFRLSVLRSFLSNLGCRRELIRLHRMIVLIFMKRIFLFLPYLKEIIESMLDGYFRYIKFQINH
jgi:hypothetical protein